MSAAMSALEGKMEKVTVTFNGESVQIDVDVWDFLYYQLSDTEMFLKDEGKFPKSVIRSAKDIMGNLYLLRSGLHPDQEVPLPRT